MTAAATPPAAATWLSLIKAASPSPIRWLRPPPHRTAYFSSTRSPGVVFLVSRTTAPVPSIASAQALVAVAIPDRWVRKLSIVRSAPSTAGAGPLTRSTASPARSRVPSGTSAARLSRQLAAGPSRYHPIRSSTASATGTPASVPASRATTSAVTVRPATVAADVTSGP